MNPAGLPVPLYMCILSDLRIMFAKYRVMHNIPVYLHRRLPMDESTGSEFMIRPD